MFKSINFNWMSIVKFSILPLAAGIMSLGSVAQAQFQLIDDFQGGALGTTVVNDTTPNVGAGATWDGDLTQDSAHTYESCLLYTSPSPRDATLSRMPSSA